MTDQADKPPQAVGPQKRRRGIARRMTQGLVSLLCTVLVLVCIAVAALQTAPAKRRLAHELEKSVAGAAGLTLKIGSIEGFVPFNVVIRNVVVSDPDGRLVEIARIGASLSPDALFDRQVVLTGVDLSGVVVHRLPKSGPDDGKAFAWPSLPSLPVRVAVSRLRLANARLAKAVLGRAVALDLSGRAALASRGEGLKVALTARWDGGAGDASLSGSYAPRAGRLSVEVKLKENKNGLLPTLAGLPDRPAYRVAIVGGGPLKASPDAPLKALSARIKAAVTGTSLVPAELAPLTGRDIALDGEVRLDASGAVRLGNIKVSAGKVLATAAGVVSDGFKRIEAKAKYRIADLAPLSGAAGTKLAGSVAGTAVISGPLDGPRVELAFEAQKLAVADLRPSLLKGTVALSGLPNKIAGTFAVSGTLRGIDARLASRFALSGSTNLKLEGIEAAAGGLNAAGRLDIALDRGTAEGALDVRAADIAAAARLGGIDAKGALNAKLALRAVGGKQGVTLDGRMTGLSVTQDGQTLAIARLAVTGRTADLQAAPHGALTATAEGLRAAGLTLTRIKVTVDGALKQGKYTIDTAGQASKPFQVASTGTYAFEGAFGSETATLKLTTLRGRFGTLPIAAAGPFTVTRKGDALQVTPLTLRIDGHPLTARAAISGKTVDIRAETRGVPAAMLRHIEGAPKLEGTIGASLSITGPAAAPRGKFAFEGRGLATAGTVKGKVPKLTVTGSGKLGEGFMSVTARITGIGSAPFTAGGRLPFALSFAPFKAAMPSNRPIAARLRGTTELAALQAIVPIGESRISGRGKVALDIGGTLAAPRVSGTAAITGGRYESITTGSILAGIELRAQGDGNTIRIQSLSANDGSGGRLSGTGRVNLIGGDIGAVEAAVELTRFRVVRLDQAKVQLSGRTRLTGTPTALAVAGQLTVNTAELSIAKKFAGSVETIDVVVIGRDGKRRVVKQPTAGNAERDALRVALDLDIDVPGKAFVRGRGLDSEWKGKLKVGGTTAAPRIKGKLEVVRGNIALLGKQFQIKSGTVAFAGNAISNPDIDFLAEAKATNLTALVRATGTAEKPTFTITSDPALPQDEVLSRLLFNKAAGKLSALQAVQLAQAAADLSGRGGGGLTERLRTAAGLATLDFEGGEKGKGGPSVRVGKYIGDRIYLSIQQGKSLDSSKVGVKIEITPNISAESTVNQAGDSDIGIFYRYDY